jgi:hypothetical protein
MSHMGKEPDIELEDVPEEEGISRADAEERVDVDPDEQVNRPDQTGPDGPVEDLED